MEPAKTCPSCQRSEPEVQFYKSAAECRGCIVKRAHAEKPKEDLDAQLEAHRKKRLLREELKKLAKAQLAEKRLARKRAAKKKAIEKIIMPPEAKSDVQVDAASVVLAGRILRRRRLIEFVQAFHPRYVAEWVHHDICRRLEQFSKDVADGKSPRLILLMPPRHGKSQIASKLFPAWHLGRFPTHEIIACSYNISLAREFSSDVREVIRSDEFSALFPKAKLDPKHENVEAWKLLPTEGILTGGYVAAGIGGPINGKGAHVLIIDDPIKNEEEASSIDMLRKIMRWFDSTAYTRLAPGGGILLIQTCWSDMDLAGQFQEQMKEDEDAEKWEVIKYPAIATEEEEFRVPGDPLCPIRWPLPALERIKKRLGGDKGRFWNALYQQNPIPDEGAMFTKDMMVWRTEPVDVSACHIYQAWDFAIGEKRTNDWTVGVTVAVDFDDTVHVLEVVRFRSSDQLKIANEMLDAFDRYPRVMAIGVEDGQIWRGVKSHLSKRMGERRLSPVIEELRPLTDKMVRATPLQGRMQQRKVTFPRSGEWVAELLKELLRFPKGMHDDIVDALAWVVHMTLTRQPPRRPKVKQRGDEDTVAQKLRKIAKGFGGKSKSAMEA